MAIFNDAKSGNTNQQVAEQVVSGISETVSRAIQDALTPVFTVFAANVKKSLEVSKDLQAEAIERLTKAFMDRLEESTQGTFQDLSRSAVEGARMQKESAEAVKTLVDGFSSTLDEMKEISQAQKAILEDMRTATEDLRSTISQASSEMQRSIRDASDAMKRGLFEISLNMETKSTPRQPKPCWPVYIPI